MEAWLFPGQGSQFVGMGAGLSGPAADATFATAHLELGWDVRSVCHDGPKELLGATEVSQPAILAVSMSIARTLEAAGRHPDAVAGHSVGELGALVVAGALDMADAFRLIQVRATAMAEAGREHEGGMAAVIGLDPDEVSRACTSTGRDVRVAAINGPDQIVISGERGGIPVAAEQLRSVGARRVIPLDVSVAAHSPLMRRARAMLEEALRGVEINPPTIPFVSCITGRSCERPDEIRHVLSAALTDSIRWVGAVRTLTAVGVSSFVEIGPGTVLSGLVHRIVPEVDVFAVGDDESIREISLVAGRAAR